MTVHRFSTRLLRPLTAACCVVAGSALATAAPAAADSIVYVKHGNLFLTSPDGTAGYQLTFDGGYSSPSQADNGTIGAVHNGQLVRLNRRGAPLNAPINAMGSPGRASSANIGGPYEPRISPDGTRFAYYFYVQSSFDDLENNIRWIDTGSYSTWTYADHFTSPVSGSENLRSLEQAEWLTNDRLIGASGPYVNIATWKLGTGHGYTWPASQWWFTLQDPPDEWGVSAYHYYSDPAVSHDGSKIAMTDGGGAQSDLLLATTNGPAWSGEPPYPEPDYVNMQSTVAAPTLRCQTATGAYANPSWSLDGSRLAYGGGDGVHVMTVPANVDCAQVADRLLVPGGSEPAFGPANVNMAQKPAPPTPTPAPRPRPRPALVLQGLSIAPHAFRVSPRARGARVARRAGALVRFKLTRSGRVTLSVMRGRRSRGRIVVGGVTGVNSVRFTGWIAGHRLGAGNYQLVATAGASTDRASFRVTK